jgi:predicted nucleotidyltransferase
MNLSSSTNTEETLPIKIPGKLLEQFCIQHKIAKLSLFGSILRDDFTDESDIDFLVEFQKGYTPTFLVLAQMEEELSNLLQGRTIDLRTPAELSPYFQNRVMAEARVQYECS